MVLSKKGRNVGPHNTKLLVTNLAELTPSQVVCIYQKRWAIEVLQSQDIKFTRDAFFFLVDRHGLFCKGQPVMHFAWSTTTGTS